MVRPPYDGNETAPHRPAQIPTGKAAAPGEGGPGAVRTAGPSTGRFHDGRGPADSTERQPAQTSASSAGTVVARPSSLRAATDLFGSIPENAGS